MADDDFMSDSEDLPDEWAAAMAEQAAVEEESKKQKLQNSSDVGSVGNLVNDANSHLETAALHELVDEGDPLTKDDIRKLDVILDVPVTLSLEVGRTKISIRNLLQLNQGSVVELDRLAGEPLDVLVNGTLIAHGEVVVVNEKFGIRLTDVISAQERIRKLR